MDRNNNTKDFDPMLCLASGTLATFAMIAVVMVVMAIIGAAAGTPVHEMFSP
jgi:L-alanine-DL-glutamate epimerase-like enolase superfamily enzyme